MGVAAGQGAHAAPHCRGVLQGSHPPAMQRYEGPHSASIVQWQRPALHTAGVPVHTAQVAPQCSGSSSGQSVQVPASHQRPSPHGVSPEQRHSPCWHTGVPSATQSRHEDPQCSAVSHGWHAPPSHQAPAAHEVPSHTQAPPLHTGRSAGQGPHEPGSVPPTSCVVSAGTSGARSGAPGSAVTSAVASPPGSDAPPGSRGASGPPNDTSATLVSGRGATGPMSSLLPQAASPRSTTSAQASFMVPSVGG